MSGDPRQVSPPHAAAPDGGDSVADPLRLCVLATVALIAWVVGPLAVVAFAGLGAIGYVRARRAGLLRSRCKLGDTRLVIAYLLVVALVAAAAVVLQLTGTSVRGLP